MLFVHILSGDFRIAGLGIGSAPGTLAQTLVTIISMRHKKVSINYKQAYMDIKAFRDSEKIEIVLRNYDEPYNPLVFEPDQENFSKIGVTMVQRISKDIIYSYAYHLNVVSVIIET